MRRGVGVGGLTRSRLRKQQFKKTGEDVATLQISKLQTQQEVFRKNLEQFADKHKSQIAKDPEFRFQFQKMCAKIGVDPLACSSFHPQTQTQTQTCSHSSISPIRTCHNNPLGQWHHHFVPVSLTHLLWIDDACIRLAHKGFWAEMLGVGSFYYELGVQIVSVCIATRVQNGGLVGLEELLELLARLRGPRATKVTIDDVERAIQKLHVFGNGYEFVKIGDRRMLQSIPCELYVRVYSCS
jgi:ESCRT-II complex subunit VPS22